MAKRQEKKTLVYAIRTIKGARPCVVSRIDAREFVGMNASTIVKKVRMMDGTRIIATDYGAALYIQYMTKSMLKNWQ